MSKELVAIQSDRALSRLAEKPTEKLLKSWARLGITGTVLVQAVDLVEMYGISLSAIATWRRVGLSFKEIIRALEFRDVYKFPLSVRLLNRYLRALSYHDPEVGDEDIAGQVTTDIEIVMEAFLDVAERLGGKTPHQRVLDYVEEHYKGEINTAYRAIVENPDGFIRQIRPSYRQFSLSNQDRRDVNRVTGLNGWAEEEE